MAKFFTVLHWLRVLANLIPKRCIRHVVYRGALLLMQDSKFKGRVISDITLGEIVTYLDEKYNG